ncbi:MAG: hypothetical protein NT137_03720 [Methanomassiliicoccales archaeon]|nr:hypothetical protein [Methanomassiliicoccales archaeon]
MRRILICPQCGSTDIFYEAGGITGQVYHCKKCDYIGALILEQEMDEESMPPIKKQEPERRRKKRMWFFRRGNE